jgi:hypothetical protein
VSTLNAFIILFTGINPQKAHACKELDFTLDLKKGQWNDPHLMLDNLPVQRENQRAQGGNPPPQPVLSPKTDHDIFENSLLRDYKVPKEEEIMGAERDTFPNFLWGVWPNLNDGSYDSSRNVSVILEIIVDRPYEVLDEKIKKNLPANLVYLEKSQEGISSLCTIFRTSNEILAKHIPHAIWRFLTNVIGEDLPCGTESMSFIVCLLPGGEGYRMLLPNLSLRDNGVEERNCLRLLHSSFIPKKFLQEAKDHVFFESHYKHQPGLRLREIKAPSKHTAALPNAQSESAVPPGADDEDDNNLIADCMIPKEEEMTEEEKRMADGVLQYWWPDRSTLEEASTVTVVLQILTKDTDSDALHWKLRNSSLAHLVRVLSIQGGGSVVECLVTLDTRTPIKLFFHAFKNLLSVIDGKSLPSGDYAFLISVPEGVIFQPSSPLGNEVRQGQCFRYHYSHFMSEELRQAHKNCLREQLKINNYQKFLSLKWMDTENDKMIYAKPTELDEFLKEQDKTVAPNSQGTTNLGGAPPEEISKEQLPNPWEFKEDNENNGSQGDSRNGSRNGSQNGSQNDKGDK